MSWRACSKVSRSGEVTVDIKQGVQIQLFNAKDEMFEAKTKLKVCLVSMRNMETNNTF